MSLRVHLWTVALRKKITKYECMRAFFRQKTRYVIISMKRREVITQLMKPLYGSKDAPRRMVSNLLTFISFTQFFHFSMRPFVHILFETKITKYEFT